MRALLALLLALPLHAQELVEVVPPESRLPSRLIVLVDTSGSMAPHLADALAAVAEVARQPVDELKILVVAWGEEPARYPGGWVKLPDEEAVESILEWLQARGAGGETDLGPALELAEQEQGGVIVVSDGELARWTIRHGHHGWAEAVEVTPAYLPAVRRLREAGRVVACLAVGGVGQLEDVAKAGGGGCWERR